MKSALLNLKHIHKISNIKTATNVILVNAQKIPMETLLPTPTIIIKKITNKDINTQNHITVITKGFLTF